VTTILDFVDSGHDFILAVDITTSNVIHDSATYCRVYFDEEMGVLVIDHTSYVVSKTE